MCEAVAAPYRQGVARALASIAREGILEAPAGTAVIEAARDSMVLRLAIDGQHVICAARHEGAQEPAYRAVLDVLCMVIDGSPIQDAAEHGAMRAMHALCVQAKARPVAGIALPRNAGAAFALAEALIRDLHSRYAEEQDLAAVLNMYTVPPAEAWRQSGHEARTDRVVTSVDAFLREHNLASDDIQILGMEPDLTGEHVRINIYINERFSPADKPRLTRAVERWLKDTVEDKLQVYMEPLQDRNAIRRL